MSKVTLADEQKCHEAIEWISRLSADGNTCTLQAIQVTFINGFRMTYENDLLLQCNHLPLQAVKVHNSRFICRVKVAESVNNKPY